MIFVCGDTHNRIDVDKLYRRVWPEGRSLTKDDYLIVLGDIGVIWDIKSNKKEKRLWKWYDELPWTTLFIDGNHENFDRLFSNEFSEIDMFGSKVKQISDTLYYLKRGFIYTIENKTFFTFGGAESTDKEYRRAHVSWWPQEEANYQEMDRAIELLRNTEYVDFVLTHTCSITAFNLMMKKTDMSYRKDSDRSLRKFFEWIENNVPYEQWHFAHFHDDIDLGDGKHYLHFNHEPKRIV